MSPGMVWFIAELIALGIKRVPLEKQATLTEAEAKALVQEITAGLDDKLPSPEELENPPQV